MVTSETVSSTDRSYKLLSRQLYAELSQIQRSPDRQQRRAIKVSKSRHNSRTKLRMKLLHIQKQDNVEFYLCCKFQLSPFNVRRKTDVTDGVTDTTTTVNFTSVEKLRTLRIACIEK